MDNIIAHNQDTEGNSELIDLRTDINGVTHESAGSAVRSQVNELKGDLDGVKNTFNTRLVNIKLSLTDEGLLHIEEVSA